MTIDIKVPDLGESVFESKTATRDAGFALSLVLPALVANLQNARAAAVTAPGRLFPLRLAG